MAFFNNKKSICLFIACLILNVDAFAVPNMISPKPSAFKRGWDQGDVGSCYSFAVASAIENYYAQKKYYGVTIAPWHFYYFQKQNLSSNALSEYNLSLAYTSETRMILNRFGPLVPSLFLPEGGQGLDTLLDGNGSLPPIELFGKYPSAADSPLQYTAELHMMEEYFLPGEAQFAGINRIQRLIANGAIMTLSLNGDYLENEYDSTFGLLKPESNGIGSGKYSETTHAVALVGYDDKGIIVKNSWNSLSQYISDLTKWKSGSDSFEARDFKWIHFGEQYQHGYFRVPYSELSHLKARRKAFSITVHNFNTDEFLNRYLKHRKNYKAISAYYVCGSSKTKLNFTNRILQMMKEGKSKQDILPVLKSMISNEMMGEYPTYRYATLPVTRINDSDTYNYYMVYAFYLNTNNSLDEFYCPIKGKRIRTPWRATESQANVLYNGMAKLGNSNSIDEQAEIWFQILPEMFNLRR